VAGCGGAFLFLHARDLPGARCATPPAGRGAALAVDAVQKTATGPQEKLIIFV